MAEQANERKLHVVVAVLGDVGRSPRMQYHAQSLLEAGHTVSLVGYDGEDLIPALQEFSGDRLRIVRFSVPTPTALRKLLPLYLFWRIVSLTLYLSWALLVKVQKTPVPDCLILQNPPAVPLVAIAYIYRYGMQLMYGKRPGIIIDWHNLGYSMFNSSLFRKVAMAYEKLMAPGADGHLTVTKAMKEYLQKEMNIASHSNIEVLYDCPPALFRVMSLNEQHNMLSQLDETLCKSCPRSWYESSNAETQTLFTECYDENKFRPRSGRPALIVSSTSWTPDEDFGILLDALMALDKQISDAHSSLRCVVVVTGKGPQKPMYQEKMSRLILQHVAIQTAWLEPGDYPKLLACADVGISLHTSTSGKDLPMKILDLFGCEIPVCAVNFECLSELVQDDVNGRVFENSDELSELLWELLRPMTSQPNAENHSYGALDRYSQQLQGRRLWSENWTENALPVIRKAVPAIATTSTDF